MVLVLTIPHSLPFRQPLLMAVIPPDAFTFTFSFETSNPTLEPRVHWQNVSAYPKRTASFGFSRKADQRRRPFFTALHRLNLILRAPLKGGPASLSASAVKHSDQNRLFVNSFDLFRSTCFVRFGSRLSPCPPQPLGAMLRASSRRP
jgi:hypothetical protein